MPCGRGQFNGPGAACGHADPGERPALMTKARYDTPDQRRTMDVNFGSQRYSLSHNKFHAQCLRMESTTDVGVRGSVVTGGRCVA